MKTIVFDSNNLKKLIINQHCDECKLVFTKVERPIFDCILSRLLIRPGFSDKNISHHFKVSNKYVKIHVHSTLNILDTNIFCK